MNDFVNDPNRPRLKKIKRPIRREGISPNFENNKYVSDPESTSASDWQDFDLNNFLDEPLADDSIISKELESTQNMPSVVEEQPLNTRPTFLQEEDVYVAQNVQPLWINKKNITLFACVAFVLGILASKLFFSPSQVVRDGLQGVVPNVEVPKGRARCGLTDKTQGCVLYLMNPQRQELNGRDFYDLASQLTGRQRFVIETGNMRYSNTKIRPGEIGQFNIPPL